MLLLFSQLQQKLRLDLQQTVFFIKKKFLIIILCVMRFQFSMKKK